MPPAALGGRRHGHAAHGQPAGGDLHALRVAVIIDGSGALPVPERELGGAVPRDTRAGRPRRAQVRREMHDQLFAALQVVPKGCPRSAIHPDEKDFACRSTTVLCYPTLAAGLAACSEVSGLPRWLRHSTEQSAEPRGDGTVQQSVERRCGIGTDREPLLVPVGWASRYQDGSGPRCLRMNLVGLAAAFEFQHI